MSGAATVTLPHALTRLFPGCATSLTVEAACVDALMDALDRRWPGMRDRLCDSTPRIRPHINVFVVGERATLATAIAPGAEVLIVTSISGG